MLIWALMNPILVWFCRQLCDCIDQVNLRCYSVGGTWLDLPVRRSWGENVLAASKWRSWLKPATASSDWAACQCSGAGKCFLFVPNSVLAPSISSHSAHGAWTWSLAFVQGIAEWKKALSHASPIPKLLTPPFSTSVAFSGVMNGSGGGGSIQIIYSSHSNSALI